MVYQLSHVLQELNFNPQWLLVEVRGAYKDESAQALEKAFNMLNYLGVNIAMDDPNSGVLSLHYLKNMPMGFLKLDSSLIADVVENQRTQMLIKAVLLFAQSMSMRVVISGIENEQQKLLCQELGCELMQGSLIGLPRLGSDILDNIVI
jgi:EAL domain-containing protein (putative c-di-GMP-specific phosphodiesterase class I)